MVMTSVNLTLVIQVCNFIVAYIIVRNLLLRPTMHVIEQEKEKKVQTLQTIENHLRANGAKEDTIARRWSSCQQQFEEQSPDILRQIEPLKEEKKDKEQDKLDQKTIEIMAEKLAHKIAQRVRHVR